MNTVSGEPASTEVKVNDIHLFTTLEISEHVYQYITLAGLRCVIHNASMVASTGVIKTSSPLLSVGDSRIHKWRCHCDVCNLPESVRFSNWTCFQTPG